jgi:hypothetical protein
MPSVPDLLHTIHTLLVLGFISVTSLFLLISLTNRIRLPRVLVHWSSGRLWGLPVWPSAFILIVAVLGVVSVVFEQPYQVLFLGYLLGGVFWLLAVRTASSVMVTERCIIRNVNRTQEAVFWGQMVDYFEIAHGRWQRYVFFYQDYQGERHRLEVKVPLRCREQFSEVVHNKLDERFEFSTQRGYGKEALEG